MAFLSLPLEIQVMIIHHASSIGGNLAALSQSCRSIRRMCDMKTRERFYQIRVGPEDARINKTFDLVMEILKSRKLGNFVREIVQTRQPSKECHYIQVPDQRELSGGDRDLLSAAVRKAGFAGPQESIVLNMLMQNTAELPGRDRGAFGFPISAYGYDHSHMHGTFIAQALAAILISVSPNLESLVMTQPFSLFSGFYRGRERPQDQIVHFPLDQFLRQANANPASIPYLQNLRKVNMIVDDKISDDRFYMAMDFLEGATLFDRLPSIESISTDALCDDENNEARVLLEPRSSNISRIHIHHSALQTMYLVSLIQSCKILREFQYTIGGRCVLGGWFAPFNARTFIKSICLHKNTLEVLNIDAEENMGYSHPFCFDSDRVEQELDELSKGVDDDDDDDDQRQMLQTLSSNSGSLKEFRALKRLSVGIGFLIYFAMGVGETDKRSQTFLLQEALPERLEYLSIRGYEKGKSKEWDRHIDALVMSFDSGLLSVKEITGIEETIPNSKDVEDPDNDEELLWVSKYSVDN